MAPADCGGRANTKTRDCGGKVLNVFTEELIEADLAIDAGVIVGGEFRRRAASSCWMERSSRRRSSMHIHTEASLL